MGLKNTDHLDQGEGGGASTKQSGSKLDPAGPTGPWTAKASGSHLDQGEGGAKSTKQSGSHLTPHPALTDKTAARGGQGVRGGDRTNPTAGKSKAGSKYAQAPMNKRTKK